MTKTIVQLADQSDCYAYPSLKGGVFIVKEKKA